VGEVPPLTNLSRQFGKRDFQFFIVYTREAHPGENYPHHESFEQKLNHADKLRSLDQVNDITILIDDVDGTAHTAYGQLPNMVYLIDREGVIVYKSDWTGAHELDGMCASLIRRDEMKANKVPIVRQGISQRLHWIPMEPAHRERIYRRSGEKAIRDYQRARGSLPYATDAEAGKK
jgi:hypothetical protein